jgi:hypothetical protein
MEQATTSRALPFLPFRCSGEGGIFCTGALVTQSSERTLITKECHRTVLEVLLVSAESWLWLFCMHLLRPIDGSSPLSVLLSRDPP